MKLSNYSKREMGKFNFDQIFELQPNGKPLVTASSGKGKTVLFNGFYDIFIPRKPLHKIGHSSLKIILPVKANSSQTRINFY